MSTTLSILFLAIVALATVSNARLLIDPPTGNNAGKPKVREGFRLLGSVETKKEHGSDDSFGVKGFGIQSYEDDSYYWDYWESVNAAGYADAKRDCESNGDSLLLLETQEEVDNVTKWLQDSDMTASSYWVGGKYDVRAKTFVWEGGLPLSPHAPWAYRQPRDKKSNTRVAIDALGREVQLMTQPSTKVTRYICEGARDDGGIIVDPPVPCYKDNDLVIVVDSSGSISDQEYTIAREFTARLAATWVDHPGSRVAVQIFSNYPEAIFGLRDDQTVSKIKDKVYNMRHIRGGTESYRAIDKATQEIQDNSRGVLRNLVFITDGQSFDRNKTKNSADQANALGIRTYSVGIGWGINQGELLDIAGGKQDHVFSNDQFDQLLTLLRPISIKVCE